jgi:hypothetical protein
VPTAVHAGLSGVSLAETPPRGDQLCRPFRRVFVQPGEDRIHPPQGYRPELAGKRVGLLGPAFKAGTNDLRHSPALGVAEQRAFEGSELTEYDPAVPCRRAAEPRPRCCRFHFAECARQLKGQDRR